MNEFIEENSLYLNYWHILSFFVVGGVQGSFLSLATLQCGDDAIQFNLFFSEP